MIWMGSLNLSLDHQITNYKLQITNFFQNFSKIFFSKIFSKIFSKGGKLRSASDRDLP